MDLNNYKHKGELVGFPKEVIAKMLEHQKEQTGVANITVFEKNISADAGDCGFTWSVTPEGSTFWNTVLRRDFEEFFKKYPKGPLASDARKFSLRDYKPRKELTGFPREVIRKMLDYQVKQNNAENVVVFENQVTSGVTFGGFSWNYTTEGHDFWYQVIVHRKFDIFFKKYPDIRI